MKNNNHGFTIVELIITMAIFITVIILVSNSFNAVLTQSTKVMRNEESNVEGVVGLEMLRHDLQQAGFGLFTEPASQAYLGEAAYNISQQTNDPLIGPPRPVVALERAGSGCEGVTTDRPDNQPYVLAACSDYLTLKASSLGISPSSSRWTYLNYAAHTVAPNIWKSAAENPPTGDSVIVLRKDMSSATNATTLVPNVNTSAISYAFGTTAFNNLTTTSTAVLNVYDIGAGNLRMPFNRADYFVARPTDTTQIPAMCAPNTGILYKAVVSQIDGSLTYIPLLDCVANMQVVFGWDTNGDGAIEVYSNADGNQTNGSSGSINALSVQSNATIKSWPSIRTSLKMIKVYVLAQVGRMDPSYSSPSPIVVGDLGETSLTKSIDINAAGWQHYRWKLYRVVVIPKNLSVNQ